MVAPFKAFSPAHSCCVTLAVFLAVWSPSTPIYFTSLDCLTFQLLLWVTYWFSCKFLFCQVSQVGFYCLHPMTQALVVCSRPWPSSPTMANSVSTVSTNTFQSYFCIVLFPKMVNVFHYSLIALAIP